MERTSEREREREGERQRERERQRGRARARATERANHTYCRTACNTQRIMDRILIKSLKPLASRFDDPILSRVLGETKSVYELRTCGSHLALACPQPRVAEPVHATDYNGW